MYFIPLFLFFFEFEPQQLNTYITSMVRILDKGVKISLNLMYSQQN